MKDSNPLFEPDRRKEPRPESVDRRDFLRATFLLRKRGAVIAALVAVVICAAIYYLFKS
jgi:hypothetical protein